MARTPALRTILTQNVHPIDGAVFDKDNHDMPFELNDGHWLALDLE
jgi:hypothetical protein